MSRGAGGAPENVLWEDLAGSPVAPPAPGPRPAPPLAGDTAADIAIIGGGYTGLLTALAVRERFPGRRVILLEAHACGSGASGRNAGMAVPGFSIDLDGLEARLGTEAARRVVAWLAEAPRLLDSLARRIGVGDSLEATGSLSLARTPRQAREQRGLVEVYARLGVEAEVLDTAALRAEIGAPGYLSGFHVPRGPMLIDPWRFVRALREAVLEAGVVVHERTPVLSIASGATLRLRTAHGVVSAPALVLATNAWTPHLGFLRNRVAPLHVACVATAPLRPAEREAIGWRRRQALWEEGRVYHFLRLTPDHRVLIGGGGGAYHPGDSLEHDGASDFRRLDAALRRIFPALADVEVTHRWTGPVAFARDFLPSIGVLGPERNVYYAAGYAGSGVALSHLAARVLCDLYSGDEPAAGARFLIDRPLPWLLAGPFKWFAINAVRNGWLALDRFGL